MKRIFINFGRSYYFFYIYIIIIYNKFEGITYKKLLYLFLYNLQKLIINLEIININMREI